MESVYPNGKKVYFADIANDSIEELTINSFKKTRGDWGNLYSVDGDYTLSNGKVVCGKRFLE